MKESDIRNALRKVIEPDLKKDIISLSMVSDIQIDGKKVTLTITLSSPANPHKNALLEAAAKAINEEVDAEADVYVHFDAEVKPSHISNQIALPGVKNIIAVSSGKGGVGKSSVAANLATALALQGAAVGLLDTDIYGPSIPLMMGIKEQRPMMKNVDGKGKIVPIENHGVKILSIGNLIDEKQAIIWRGPMASSALKQFITDVIWGELDYLILDLPPGTGDIHLTLLQNFPLSGAVIVTTPQKVATADTRKGIMMFQTTPIKIPILGIIENMAYFVPPDMPEKKYYIFGQDEGKKMAEQFEIPFLGEIPIYEEVRKSSDAGIPVVLDEESPASEVMINISQKIAQELALLQAQSVS